MTKVLWYIYPNWLGISQQIVYKNNFSFIISLLFYNSHWKQKYLGCSLFFYLLLSHLCMADHSSEPQFPIYFMSMAILFTLSSAVFLRSNVVSITTRREVWVKVKGELSVYRDTWVGLTTLVVVILTFRFLISAGMSIRREYINEHNRRTVKQQKGESGGVIF